MATKEPISTIWTAEIILNGKGKVREMKKSAALLKKYLPTMTERVFPDMGHCQFLHEHPEEYAALLDRTMRNDG